MIPVRPPEGRYDLDVEGERLVLHRWGTRGPVAFALHGMMSDHRELGALPAALAEAGFTVIAPDFRGCGASAGRRSLQTLDRMLADLSHAVAKVGPPVFVVGHSLGAAVAIRATADGLLAPRALVAAAPPDFPRRPWSFALASRLAGITVPLPRRYAWTIRNREARAWAAGEDFKSHRFPLATWSGLRDLRVREAARGVTCPTLVLLAETDHVVARALSVAVYEALPHARMSTVAGYHSLYLCDGAERALEETVACAKSALATS